MGKALKSWEENENGFWRPHGATPPKPVGFSPEKPERFGANSKPGGGGGGPELE